MKVITAKTKKSSDWTQDIVEASIQKEASLGVNVGKVICPMTNKLVSTVSCELCQHCKGIDFKLASATENVRCTYFYDTGDKEDSVDSMEKFHTSNVKEQDQITPDDLKSIFAKNEPEYDFTEEDRMSESKIVSAKNLSEDEFEGSSSFISEYNNSIFDSGTLSKLADMAEQEQLEKEAKDKEAAQEEAERRSEWMTDRAQELEDIKYTHQTAMKSISHEAEASNPDVGDYKFSVFDNIEEKLDSIPDRTDGELLKEQKADRKRSISRKSKKDDWESQDKSPTTSASIVGNFFGNLFEGE